MLEMNKKINHLSRFLMKIILLKI